MLEQMVARGLPRAPSMEAQSLGTTVFGRRPSGTERGESVDAALSGGVLLPGPGASVHPAERLFPDRMAGTGRLAARAESAKLQGQSPGRDVLGSLMGESGQIDEVFQQVAQVAGSPLTTLIEGETGTGKELVARAIHHLSLRRRGPFIALDCGAIPETLIESELFGYEKGAFTGADQRKEGHFQMAGGGSLLLDEIANLPL